MADVKFSEFASGGQTQSGDIVVGLRSGVNTQFTSGSTLSASAFAGWDSNTNLKANNLLEGYTTTPTAAALTTLSVSSTYFQYFTGSTTQTCRLPVTSTLVLGQSFYIVNSSTGVVTVQSSGTNTIQAMAANTSALVTCILTSGTTAASWNVEYASQSGGSVSAGTQNQLAYYATTGNTVSGLSTANSAVLVTTNAGVPGWSSTMTNGQLVIGSTTSTPTVATLTAGSGISVTNGAGSITIATSGGGLSWSGISGTTQAAAVNSGYVVQNAGQTTITLPATAAIGDSISVRGLGAAGWILTANTGQTIKYIASTTSSGGTLTSSSQYDTIEVTCIVANTTWAVAYSASLGLTIA